MAATEPSVPSDRSFRQRCRPVHSKFGNSSTLQANLRAVLRSLKICRKSFRMAASTTVRKRSRFGQFSRQSLSSLRRRISLPHDAFLANEGSTGIHVSSIWPLETLARKGSNADPASYPDWRNATRRLATLGGTALNMSERLAAARETGLGSGATERNARRSRPAAPYNWAPASAAGLLRYAKVVLVLQCLNL